MDHIPLPKSCPTHPPVPLLKFGGTTYCYGKTQFLEFPSRNGFNKLKLEYTRDYTNEGSNSSEEASAFVQEWLWFGLLSKFLERDIDVERFICNDNDSGPVITTKSLPYVLTDWCREIDSMSPEPRKNRLERVEKLLKEARKFVSGI
jgi:hypothetical protein